MLSGVSGKLDRGSNTFFFFTEKYRGTFLLFFFFFTIIYQVQKDFQLHFNTEFCVLFHIRKKTDSWQTKKASILRKGHSVCQGEKNHIISQN